MNEQSLPKPSEWVALSCGCVVLRGVVWNWCEYHFENQPRMGDPLYLHFVNNGKYCEEPHETQ